MYWRSSKVIPTMSVVYSFFFGSCVQDKIFSANLSVLCDYTKLSTDI
jgi:hypothetical protein